METKSQPPKSVDEVKPDAQHDEACARLIRASKRLQAAAARLREFVQDAHMQDAHTQHPF
jgi:hypothetical protein